MARTKSVAPEALAALGAEALAQVLIAHADTDPVLRKKLVMLLASTEGSGKLAAEIDKRIKTIGRSRSFVDWEKRKLLVQELDHLRATIATRLAAQDRERAIELLWDFLGIADAVLERMGDGIGAVEEIFGAAMEDLGRFSATPPPRNPKALARRVLAYCERGFGSTDALIRHMGEALGVAGRTETGAPRRLRCKRSLAPPNPVTGRATQSGAILLFGSRCWPTSRTMPTHSSPPSIAAGWRARTGSMSLSG